MFKGIHGGRVALAFCLVCALSVGSSLAQSASSWDCLPEETIVAIRVPNGQGLTDAMRETKFGAVMFKRKTQGSVAGGARRAGIG